MTARPAARRSEGSAWLVILSTAAGLLLALLLGWQFRRHFLRGANEFLQLYAGARLVGSPDLYNPRRVREVQMKRAGTSGEALLYTRLPFVAGLLRPIGRLPYRPAYPLWELLAFAAFAGFVALWRPPSLSSTWMFSWVSLTAFVSLIIGEDATFLLLWIAAAVWLDRHQRPFASGLALSCCGTNGGVLAVAWRRVVV